MLKFLKNLMGGNEQQSTTINEIKNEEVVKEHQTNSPHTQVEIIKPSTNEVKGNTFRIPPVISDPTQRGFDNEFRLEDDDNNVIRINQRQPQGFPKKIAEFITVVGITKENRDITASKFIKGKDRTIELKKQTDNPYDKNAIEVYGLWTKQGKSFSEKLGYIPSKVASKLASENELKATIKVIYTPTDETSIGIRIDIWTKMTKRKKVDEKSYVNIAIPESAVDRNIKAQDLEKEGYIDNAIELYELNVKGKFDGNFPYDRLAIIYRKRKQYEEEIRVLEQGINVFEALEKTSPRLDIAPKLNKFKEKLAKVKDLSLE